MEKNAKISVYKLDSKERRGAEGRERGTDIHNEPPTKLHVCSLWLRKRAFSFVPLSLSLPQGILPH